MTCRLRENFVDTVDIGDVKDYYVGDLDGNDDDDDDDDGVVIFVCGAS